MQTESEQVMYALQGWPQCWSCRDFQKPHLRRVTAMRRRNTDMCLCTPCRSEQVRCTSCCEPKARWAMRWRQDLPMAPWTGSGPDYACHGTWRGCCTSCARRVQLGDKNAFRTYTQFYSYPNGTPANVPWARYRSGGYKRTHRASTP